ncbi:MAG TPA: hypothetical protein VHE14_05900 [Solirubrobacteraceae bacterium]|nr:hypothetical protein [Solirubrobacteraceae bacterium]
MAASAPPAGGTELGQAIAATAAAAVVITGLLVLGLGHRSGRIRLLGAAAAESARVSGLPGWAALPAGIAGVSLLGAVFGLYWDISLHIDNGRDPGPLANPAHYFILAGLFGILAAGWIAVVLPTRRPGPAAIRIARDWHAPIGGVLLMACASFAMLGFPLDDVWHRLFGQDVTLWGPTHLMMLTGAALTLVGILCLLVEGRLAARSDESASAAPVSSHPLLRVPDVAVRLLSPLRARKVRLVAACGGVLVGLSIYQAEFDFGVPQYRLLFHPVLIALAASIALVAARIVVGRGAALWAALFFIAVRGILTLLVGPAFGESTAHFPLYIAEALLVEGVALRIGPARPYRFGVVAGALVGSVGVVAEWAWSQAWMPIAWPAHLLPEAVAVALPVAVAGGVIGAFFGGALRLRADAAATPRAWAAVGASVLVIGAAFGYGLHTTVPAGARAQVTVTDVRPSPRREVQASVRFIPPSVARQADWLEEIAWQGHGKLLVRRLRRVADGVYTTVAPIPVYGSWKSGIRLQRGPWLASIPVYLPADTAIPAAEVPAPPRFERAFAADRLILQRERKHGVPAWLWDTADAVVLCLLIGLLLLLAWGLARLARCGSSVEQPEPTEQTPARAPARALSRVA